MASRKPVKSDTHWPVRHLFGAAALCAATLLAYSNSFQAGFTLDNQALLLQDPRIRDVTPKNLGLIHRHSYWWPHGESNLYRPFTTLSYLFNYAVLGNADHAAGYHWINLLLHLVNVLLAYTLLLKLTRKFWLSVWTAGLWALHPVLTESVTNMVGRPDLLVGAAVLSGILMYGKAIETNGPRRLAWLGGLFAVTLVGVFSKESAVVIPGALALYELYRWREAKGGRVFLLACLAVVPPIAAMLVQRSRVLAGLGPVHIPFADNPLTGASFWTARLTAWKLMASYVGLTVWPAKLSCDYSYAEIQLAQGSYQDWISWAIVAGLAAGVVILFRRKRAACFLGCFAFLTFLPTANLLFPIGTIMAERFLYLPSLGLIGCAMLATSDWFRWPRIATPFALGLVASGLGLRTWIRNADWRDNVTLYTASVSACPRSYKTHAMLASALFTADPDHTNIDRVIGEAEESLRALERLPDIQNVAPAYAQAGNFYLLKGDMLLQALPSGELKPTPASNQAYQRSLGILQRCISIFQVYDRRYQEEASARGRPAYAPALPVYGNAYRMLAIANLRLLRTDQALEAAQRARSLDPGNPAAYSQVSDILRIEGRTEEAAVALLTGALFTSDAGLRRDLMQLYRSGLDSQGCATISGPDGPAINPSCLLVHRDLCAAAGEMIRLQLASGSRDLAVKTRSRAVTEFGCVTGPLDGLLLETPQ